MLFTWHIQTDKSLTLIDAKGYPIGIVAKQEVDYGNGFNAVLFETGLPVNGPFGRVMEACCALQEMVRLCVDLPEAPTFGDVPARWPADYERSRKADDYKKVAA